MVKRKRLSATAVNRTKFELLRCKINKFSGKGVGPRVPMSTIKWLYKFDFPILFNNKTQKTLGI